MDQGCPNVPFRIPFRSGIVYFKSVRSVPFRISAPAKFFPSVPFRTFSLRNHSADFRSFLKYGKVRKRNPYFRISVFQFYLNFCAFLYFLPKGLQFTTL